MTRSLKTNMKDSWICRDYQRGDEYEILTFYKQVNEREMTLAHWKWKFAKNPFGKSVIKLMFDDKKLIGSYAVIPMNVQVQRNLVKAALSVNTMTHPNYERQGIFSYLAEEVYKKCLRESFGFVYGFPNENSYHGFTRKLGWKDLGKMTTLEKKLGVPTLRETCRRDRIYPVEEFNERVNSLWNTTKDSYHVTVARTEEFLNWRFAEHPTEKYAKFILQDDSKQILGYLVLKTYANGDEVKGHIVDMLCINEKDIVKDLIRYSQNYLVERGIKNLSCWASEESFYAQVLEREEFTRKEFNVYFGVRTFDKEDELLRNVEQPDNWHLTMCDLDVF